MNDFYNTQLFLDPYAVEGEERAKRFAKNYNAQQRLGIPGVLEGWAIIREAERNLPPTLEAIFQGHSTEARLGGA